VARSAWGDGIAALNRSGATLAVAFEALALGTRANDGHVEVSLTPGGAHAQSESCFVSIRDLDEAPANVGDAYLRLHLLSHRLVRPNDINLDGIFTILPNVCWTSVGPVGAD
jgi:2,3,4,5-tetrahydropyridine-2-carboxylate N-succinyltransferase